MLAVMAAEAGKPVWKDDENTVDRDGAPLHGGQPSLDEGLQEAGSLRLRQLGGLRRR